MLMNYYCCRQSRSAEAICINDSRYEKRGVRVYELLGGRMVWLMSSEVTYASYIVDSETSVVCRRLC